MKVLIRVLWTVMLPWCVFWAIHGARRHLWWAVVVQGTCFVFYLFQLIRDIRRFDRHGHRKAAEDRDGAGAGSSAGAGPGLPFSIPVVTSPLVPRGTAYLTQGAHFAPGQGAGAGVAGPSSEDAARASVPEFTEAEPFRGWKEAHLQFTGGRYFLRALAVDWTHTVDGYAVCLQSHYYPPASYWHAVGLSAPAKRTSHEAPELECTCGFYAHDLREKLSRAPSYVQLEVDLFGRVIEGEKGYRAARQRILGVHVPRRCYFCAAPPDRLVLHGVPIGSVPSGTTGVVPMCDEHRADQIAVGISDLAGILGTEVRWIEAEVSA